MRFTKKMLASLLALLLMFSPMAGLPLATDGFAADELVLKTSVSPATFSKGDTVTVTVSLEGTVNTRTFGLDYTNAYDHDVFEWVDGDWSKSIKDEAILCEAFPGTQAAFMVNPAKDITGELLTFQIKATGEFSCEDTFEIKVTPSDLLKATAVGTTLSASHAYDNPCDPDCSVCGANRGSGHNYEQEITARTHRKKCSVCGTVDEAFNGVHVYDNIDDTSCAVCGYIRKAPTFVHAIHRGDEVTVSIEVTNQEAVASRGFGLDLLDSYDADVFEWVSGNWSKTILDNALLHQVNPGSEAVFASEKEISLSGEIFTMVLKAKADAPFAEYDVVPALRGNSVIVLSTTVVTVHECQAADTAESNEDEHWYSCRNKFCTEKLNRAPHGYDNACDADCNGCGRVRTITHDYSIQDKDAENHWMKCSVCGAVDESTRAAHDHDNACDADCNTCGQTRTITHDYSIQDKDAENHWMKCSVCGAVDESTRKAHDHDNACDADCNTCGQTRTVPGHVYDDHDDLTCNECGFVRPPYTVGDADNNGTVEMEDAIHLLFHVNFPANYTVSQPVDYDNNGKVEMEDAIYLLFHVNFPASYPLFPEV